MDTNNQCSSDREIVERSGLLNPNMFNDGNEIHVMSDKGFNIRGLTDKIGVRLKVARYSFSVSIPPKFERKLRRHKQKFGKINTTVVLDKDENLL